MRPEVITRSTPELRETSVKRISAALGRGAPITPDARAASAASALNPAIGRAPPWPRAHRHARGLPRLRRRDRNARALATGGTRFRGNRAAAPWPLRAPGAPPADRRGGRVAPPAGPARGLRRG